MIELQRIFYTVNPVQVSGGSEQNVWGGGQAASLGGGQLPPLPRPRTATATETPICNGFDGRWSFNNPPQSSTEFNSENNTVWKLVHICRSYRKKLKWSTFLGHGVDIYYILVRQMAALYCYGWQ